VSYYDYRMASDLLRGNPPFYALIMAAMQRADTPNAAKLRAAWPEVWAELNARYHTPGGYLDGERIPTVGASS